MKEDLVAVLEGLRRSIFTKERLFIDITSTEEGYGIFDKAVGKFTDQLYDCDVADGHARPDVKPNYHVTPMQPNEAFITSGGVQFVARAGNYDDKGISYSGAFRVLKTILSYEYLWNEVRVKGGAYGIMCNFLVTGSAYVVSYRDPNLKETNDIYGTVAEYLRNIDLSERDLTKFIIGSIRDLDAPLTPKGIGSRSYTSYMSGTTQEEIQRVRDELLATTNDTLREAAAMFDAFLSDGYICVVGSEDKVRAAEKLFGTIKVLK